jgi:hypothetical protein
MSSELDLRGEDGNRIGIIWFDLCFKLKGIY